MTATPLTAPPVDTATTRHEVARHWGDLATRLDDLPADRLRGPVGLAGWTVADLAAHVVWGVSMEAVAVTRALDGDDRRADGVDVDPSEPDRLRTAFAAARADLDAALARTHGLADEAPVPLAVGPVPWGMVRSVLVMEAGVHADDLRLALDVDRDLAPVVVASTLAFLRGFAAILGSAGAPPPPVGTRIRGLGETVAVDLHVTTAGWALAVPAGDADASVRADDTTVVRWLMGRPDPRLAAAAVTGDRALVEGVKTWFPGP